MQLPVPSDTLAPHLATMRRVLRRTSRLARWLQATRALVHFGPWRHAARAVIRTLRPARGAAFERVDTLLPPHDIPAVTSALRSDGVHVLGVLPADTLAQLRRTTDVLPRGEYGRFHEHDAVIGALVQDRALLAILRTHFGAEPELLECTVVVHEAEGQSPIGPNSQRRLHFDYAGWQSLNLFLYLTDVDGTSGAHEIAPGTHHAKSLRDLLRPSLDDHEASQRFGHILRQITGPAGTLFLEDTEAFHRRGALRRRRVMLNALFASHRGLLSQGRLTRRYGDYLAQVARSASR